MRHGYRAYVGRQTHSGKIVIEEVLPDGKSIFHDWDHLPPTQRRWFRLIANDPLRILGDLP